MFIAAAANSPVIFLDIDYVIGNDRAQAGIGQWLDPVATGLLRNLAQHSTARIVVTSTWRISPDRCLAAFTDHQLLPYLWSAIGDAADDWRVDVATDCRSTAIDQWLSNHPAVTQWVILDDSLSSLTASQLLRLVHVHTDVGLTIRNVSQALRILAHGAPAVAQDDRSPRITIAHLALLASQAIDQGDIDHAQDILRTIAGHPLAH